MANVRSISNKIDELYATIVSNQIQILCLTETWLNDNFSPTSINFPDFSIVRRDRSRKMGGGVLIAIKQSWSYEICEISDEFESIWILCRNAKMPRRYSHLAVAVIYHHPGANNYELQKHILSTADKISIKHPNCLFMITGDFNHFKDNLIASFPFKQLIKHETRGQSVLDRVYTNDVNAYNEILNLPNIGKSDHSAVLCIPAILKTNKPTAIFVIKRSFTAVNKTLILNEINSINWTQLYRLNSCKDQVKLFYDLLITIINNYAPVCRVKVTSYVKPWVTMKFVSLIKKRQRAFMAGDFTLFRKYRNYIIRMTKYLKRDYYEHMKAKLDHTDSRAWWKLTNDLLDLDNNKHGLSALVNDQFGGDTAAFVDTANKFFTSLSATCTPVSAVTNNPETNSELDDYCSNFVITPQSVLKKLLKVSTCKASGPDDIPNWLLKDAALSLYLPVAAIFNSSMREGFVPCIWKTANVSLIPKKKKITSIEKDLRPISVTSTLGKILESFICKYLKADIEEKLDINQFGCLAGKSTTHALLTMTHELLKALDNNKAVRLLLIDYEKAFDRIDHSLLIQRVTEMGVHNSIVKWLRSFLSDRCQKIVVNGTKSSWCTLNGGMPQGSCLGPLCYIIANDSLRSEPETGILIHKFVDDTTITEIYDKGNSSNLQYHADNVRLWSNNNHMIIKADKTLTCSLSLATNKNFNTPTIPITIGNRTVVQVEEFKLLGVWFTSNCKWNKHIDDIRSKANYMLLLLRRLKRSGLNTCELLKYYMGCMRPALEYACQVWHTMLSIKHYVMF